MIVNNIGIIQQKENQYLLYLDSNLCVGNLIMPKDHQYIEDSKALEVITKEVAIRWGVYQKKSRKG